VRNKYYRLSACLFRPPGARVLGTDTGNRGLCVGRGIVRYMCSVPDFHADVAPTRTQSAVCFYSNWMHYVVLGNFGTAVCSKIVYITNKSLANFSEGAINKDRYSMA
jgi:hypothetical protein